MVMIGLLMSCATAPSYISVLGADENNPEMVAYVVNKDIPETHLLWLYSVDGQKVHMEPMKREYYAIHPGSHVLWVLAPMKAPGDIFMKWFPNRCFVFEVDLVAGTTYYLESFDGGKVAKLVSNDFKSKSVPGRMVDESWWTCYWEK